MEWRSPRPTTAHCRGPTGRHRAEAPKRHETHQSVDPLAEVMDLVLDNHGRRGVERIWWILVSRRG